MKFTPIAFISRFLFPPNFSLLGTYGYYGSFWGYLSVILVYDLLVGGLYRGVLWTYLGFMMYPLMGRILPKFRPYSIILASFLFFFFSNFGVWLYWYPHTLSGLILCYTLALPFYKNTFISDLLFSAIYLVGRWWVGGVSTQRAATSSTSVKV